MNYLSKNFVSLKLKIALSGLLVVLVFILFHGTASAALPIPNNFLPRASDFSQGNGVYLIAAQYGNGYLLEAPVSTVRFYSPYSDNTINIVNGGHCIGSGPDRGPDNSEATTTFRIYSLVPDDSTPDYVNTPFGARGGLLRTVTSTQIGCAPSYAVAFSSNQTDAQWGPASGKFGFEIVADMEGPPGWNMFKYNVAAGGGRFSYYAGSGDKFGLKDSTAGIPGESGDFRLGFAPGCGLKLGSSTTVTLKWFDADAGEPNQPGANPIPTRLLEYDENNNYTGSANDQAVPVGTGNNVSGSKSITVKGNYKYEWLWPNIYSANGIQFQLPFDSYNTLIDFGTDCTTRSTSASCSATPAFQSILIKSGTNIDLKVTNTGNTAWAADFQLRQTSPGGGVRTMGSSVAPGASRTFTFNIQPRDTPQTITFQYNMFNSSGSRFPTSPNPLCSAVVQWRNRNLPPGRQGGGVEVNCSSLKYTGDDMSVDAAGNFPNGKPYYFAPQPGLHNASSYSLGYYVSVSVTHKVVTTGMTPQEIKVAQLTDNDPGYQMFIKVPPGVLTISTVSLLPLNLDGSARNLFATNSYGSERPHYEYLYTVRYTLVNAEAIDNNGNGQQDYQEADFNIPPIAENVRLNRCLKTPPVCRSFSTATSVEPGQGGTSTYGFSFELTDATDPFVVSYDVKNGIISGAPRPERYGDYSFDVTTSGGINAVGISVTGKIDGSQAVSNVDYNMAIQPDYEGEVTVHFYYGNQTAYWEYGKCKTTVTPKTRPFFKVLQGDIATGGGFRSGTSCSTNPATFISPSTQGNKFAGGLRAFANPNARKGSSADFAAYALGVIQGTSDGPLGFFSGLISGADLRFANTTEPLGGQLDNGVFVNYNAHCATDYFTVTQNSPIAQSAGDADINALAPTPGSYQYLFTPASGVLNLNGSLSKGTSLTIYVDGDVNIHKPITYDGGWSPAAGDVPYLAVIVKGNIHVAGAVERIDGFYVAQPKTGQPNSGIFSTCSFAVDFAKSSNMQNCRPGPLTVNGSIIAQKIYMARTNGTLCKEEASCGAAAAGNVAEFFNFTPSMVLGLPAFAPPRSGAIVPASLEALFSLPPIF